jgi:two-component system copper resistance phosphate regulon response regulator CusR
VVEDDDDLADTLTAGLRQAAYAVDRGATVADARAHLEATRYDVVCLDLGLPDGDGLDLLRAGRPPGRVLILTARDAVDQRIAGLDAGADDYLVKPFALGELLARIRAVTRRPDQPTAALEAAGITLDPAAMAVHRHGVPIELTAREFAVLRYLLAHAGEVVSSERLLDHVWDAHANPFTTSVKVIMSRLRRKLGSPPAIETVTGAGYRLPPDPPAGPAGAPAPGEEP